MSGYTAIIAEDEPVLAQALAQALQSLWPALRIAAQVSNGGEAVKQALAHLPNVLFLDIKMPGMSGLEAARVLAEDWPDGSPFPLVVFVTAYEDFALQAFEQAAADYVLKPVSNSRLASTVSRLQARLAQPLESSVSFELLLTQLRALTTTGARTDAKADANADAKADAGASAASATATAGHGAGNVRLSTIHAAVGNQVRLIPVSEVVYFEATDKYVRVVTADGESLIRTPLKELLPQLDPDSFRQIHRSTVVNMRCVDAAVRDENGKIFLRLRNHTETLPVSRLFAHLFRQM